MLSKSSLNLFNSETFPELNHNVVPSNPKVVTNNKEIPSPVSVQRRIINVTNELPIKASKLPGEKWEFELDEDALSFQLKDGLDPHGVMLYVGSLKADVAPAEQDEVSSMLIRKYRCYPVFMQRDVQDKFYHGFCKKYLWPLFHYKLPMLTGSGFDREDWQAYVSANELFAHKVIEVMKLGDGQDFVWVHDYHLMLLPAVVRSQGFRVKIGFFLHCPFPSSEIFRVIPTREEILKGLLNVDVIGFHSLDYARHFVCSCGWVLGSRLKFEKGNVGMDYCGRMVRLKILPVGIHVGRLQMVMSKPETAARVKELKDKFKSKVVVVGIDDMDVFKGISLKFLAFGLLLENQPELRGTLVLVQIANPARTKGKDIEEEQKEATKIAQQINAKYGKPGYYEPIVFINEHVSTMEKVAYSAISDIHLSNAIRDGMNLEPFKYTICRQGTPELDLALGKDVKKESVIIVSEFVGCWPSLCGATQVNPWNVEQVSEAIYKAIWMDERDKQARHAKHLRYITSHDIGHWARSFLQDLVHVCETEDPVETGWVFLDCDATIMPEFFMDDMPTDQVV